MPFTAEVLLQLGERQDVVDAVLARGSAPQGEPMSAERVALQLSLPCSRVILLPPNLPSLAHLAASWETASYGMSLDDWNALELSATFKARPCCLQPPHEQLTLHCTGLCHLGEQRHPAGPHWPRPACAHDRLQDGWHHPPHPGLQQQGAAGVDHPKPARLPQRRHAGSLHVVRAGRQARPACSLAPIHPLTALPARHNKPSSVATDVGEALHVHEYLLSKLTNADERADVAALQARAALLCTASWHPHPPKHTQDCTRLLCNQLRALPAHKRSVEELREAGEYADLAELWLQIDTYLDSIDFSVHTEANARKAHDALMLLLCFREHPITRPTCMRLLLVPGVLEACNQCSVAGCLGNSWQGNTAVIRHYKTAGTYGNHVITVQPGSKTEQVLEQYTTWARPLLLKEPASSALFLTRYGRPFIRDGCFNKYLPRLLLGLSGAKLSWTKVRLCDSLPGAAGTHTASPCSCATSPPTVWCHWPQLTSWRAWLPACRRGARAARGAVRPALSHTLPPARASSSRCTRTTAVSLSATWAWSCTSLLAEQAEAELAWRASPRRTRRMSSNRLAVPLLRRRSSSWHWCLSPLSPLLPWLLARQCARPWRTCCRSCRSSA